jgi:hypothetical protein
VISHRHRFIFIHIPKTAGTSIEKALGGAGEAARTQDHRRLRDLEAAIVPRGPALLGPSTARFVFQRVAGRRQGFAFVDRDQFAAYFKFAFVRNPWARVFSWYRNVMRDPAHRAEHRIDGDLSLEAFLERHGDSWALRPQTDWLCDAGGNLSMDFVGRFERLEADFATVCERIGLAPVTLPHELRAGAGRWSDAYSDRARTLVAERYAEEIALFGYAFGD